MDHSPLEVGTARHGPRIPLDPSSPVPLADPETLGTVVPTTQQDPPPRQSDDEEEAVDRLLLIATHRSDRRSVREDHRKRTLFGPSRCQLCDPCAAASFSLASIDYDCNDLPGTSQRIQLGIFAKDLSLRTVSGFFGTI